MEWRPEVIFVVQIIGFGSISSLEIFFKKNYLPNVHYQVPSS